MWLAHECPHAVGESLQDHETPMPARVMLHPWQGEPVPAGQQQHDGGQQQQRYYPCHGNAVQGLQLACQDDDASLAEYAANAVEGAAHAYEEGLLVLVQAQDVEPVGGDVVGGAAERHEPEESKAELQPAAGAEGEGYPCQCPSHEYLHAHYPPHLGAQCVDDGAPHGLNHPWQVEPAGVKGNLGVAQPKVGVQYHRECHDRHVWYGLGEIQRRHPSPWIDPAAGTFPDVFHSWQMLDVYSVMMSSPCSFPRGGRSARPAPCSIRAPYTRSPSRRSRPSSAPCCCPPARTGSCSSPVSAG